MHNQITAPVRYLPEYLHEEPGRVLRGALSALRPALLRARSRRSSCAISPATRRATACAGSARPA
jgi:hypothetical protein